MRPVDELYLALFGAEEVDAELHHTRKKIIGDFLTDYQKIISEATLKGSPDPAPYKIPGPYEIALTFGTALAASGKYESPGAAMDAAWMAVPEFFQARDRYLTEMVPMFYGGTSATGEIQPMENLPIGGAILDGELTSEHEWGVSRAMRAMNIQPPQTPEQKLAFLADTREENKGPNFPHEEVEAYIQRTQAVNADHD